MMKYYFTYLWDGLGAFILWARCFLRRIRTAVIKTLITSNGVGKTISNSKEKGGRGFGSA